MTEEELKAMCDALALVYGYKEKFFKFIDDTPMALRYENELYYDEDLEVLGLDEENLNIWKEEDKRYSEDVKYYVASILEYLDGV